VHSEGRGNGVHSEGRGNGVHSEGRENGVHSEGRGNGVHSVYSNRALTFRFYLEKHLIILCIVV
jgi:hypothetical protein